MGGHERSEERIPIFPYLLETGRIKSSGPSAELLASDEIRKAYLGI